MGRAQIHPEGPEEPQIRLESGEQRDLLGIVVQPLDLHLVNVGSIPTGPTHGEVRLQPHPGDVLKSTPECPEEPQIRVDNMFITEFTLKLDPPSLRSGLGMAIVAAPRQ